MATRSEVKYYFCNDHIDNISHYFRKYHPSYRFNTYYSFKLKKCHYTNCPEPSCYESIGIQIPEVISELTPQSKINTEIFNAAKIILMGGSSIDRLVVYLKTIIIPMYKTVPCDKLIRHHASMILSKLKIKEDLGFTSKDINAILKELKVYPDDEE